MSLIDQGIEKGLIKFSEDKKRITYIHQDKSRSYSNPEEKVQTEIFLKLVLEYGYPVEHIEQFKTVTMGADKREADIIVHENAEWDKSIEIYATGKKNYHKRNMLEWNSTAR